MYYRDYNMYMRVLPDSDWQFVIKGRISFRSMNEYDKILEKIRCVLNKNSVYEFKITPFYDRDIAKQLEIPY